MSGHAAAMALLVPVCPLATGVVEVPGQAAVITVLVGALAGEVAVGSTQEAGQQLLQTQKDTTRISVSHRFVSPEKRPGMGH